MLSQNPFEIPPGNYSREWLYQDNHGRIQGPFDAVGMFQWYQQGYLQPTLLVSMDG